MKKGSTNSLETIEKIRKSIKDGFKNGRITHNKDKTKYTYIPLMNVSNKLKDKPKSKEHIEKLHLSYKNRSKNIYYIEGSRKGGVNCCKLLQNRKGVNSDIECVMIDILSEMDMKYENQRDLLDRTVADNYLPEYNIAIYCDGDYWHANPKFYKADSIMKNGRTAKEIWNEDRKQNYTLRTNGYIVLRFWGDDIFNRREEVKEKILLTIKKLINNDIVRTM